MKIILTGLMLFFSTWATATPLNKIVVFGDSLSDNGNLYEYMKHKLPISPPYFEGRFTNGPVWIENIATFYYPDDAEAHLLDYAFGGSGVSEPDDGDEDENYYPHREISPNEELAKGLNHLTGRICAGVAF